jgi:hypothetical protein
MIRPFPVDLNVSGPPEHDVNRIHTFPRYDVDLLMLFGLLVSEMLRNQGKDHILVPVARSTSYWKADFVLFLAFSADLGCS